MRLCELQCYLALLGLSLVLCGRSANSQLEPDLDFRHRRLLQRARAIGQATQVSLECTLTHLLTGHVLRTLWQGSLKIMNKHSDRLSGL